MRGFLEVADVFRAHGPAYRQTHEMPLRHLQAMRAIETCRTAALGGHVVMEYLGRYTHRVAISNDRLVTIEAGQVTFKYRDRNDNNQTKLMTLNASEFIRRFLLHILSDGFVKIRHYGVLSNRSRNSKLARSMRLLGAQPLKQNPEKPGSPGRTCLNGSLA